MRDSERGLGCGGSGISQSCGIEAAEGLVERRYVAELGVVGEDRKRIRQDIFDEPVKRFLGADFDKDPRARFVECMESLDKLDGGGKSVSGSGGYG